MQCLERENSPAAGATGSCQAAVLPSQSSLSDPLKPPPLPLPHRRPQAKWEASDNKPALVATAAAGLMALYITAGVLNT